MAGPQFYPLVLGTLNFDGRFEGPNGWEEGLGDVGSEQQAVVKKFPGGTMSAQLQGSFPKPIKIRGRIKQANARSRSFQFQKLVDDGNLINLTYAEYNFPGFAKDYSPYIKAPDEIWFLLEFQPLANNSTFTDGATTAPAQDPMAGTVANAAATAQQQSTSPTNGFQMPANIQSGVSSLNSLIAQQLQLNGGVVKTLSKTAQKLIQAQISLVSNMLNPFLNGKDPVAASAAAELNATLSIMNVAFTPNVTLQKQDSLTVVNPNLYHLAAFYYDDPAQWESIAIATNAQQFKKQPDITDPLPTGTFHLIIPPKPISLTTPPPTVMQDALSTTS